MRPVSLAAPRMVVWVGADEYAPSGVSGVPRGVRPMRREQNSPLQLPSLQATSKLETPAPRPKNGRRSEKNVSKAERLTTAGSASTWPKSGLTVPVSVRPGFTAYLKSTPSEPSGSVVLINELPGSDGWVVTSPTTYGTTSRRFGDRSRCSPVSSPNDET